LRNLFQEFKNAPEDKVVSIIKEKVNDHDSGLLQVVQRVSKLESKALADISLARVEDAVALLNSDNKMMKAETSKVGLLSVQCELLSKDFNELKTRCTKPLVTETVSRLLNCEACVRLEAKVHQLDNRLCELANQTNCRASTQEEASKEVGVIKDSIRALEGRTGRVESGLVEVESASARTGCALSDLAAWKQHCITRVSGLEQQLMIECLGDVEES